ncbi:DNA primase family protein [Enteractinococcus helveticum]|uniref:DNA primase family protein n=1 Tax=Enteractinococcus helveticum TaxID=1837282 RepID=UPI001F1A9299|nr:phage/plasmid primase, P4 family [Enteractinococcus helveticum]
MAKDFGQKETPGPNTGGIPRKHNEEHLRSDPSIAPGEQAAPLTEVQKQWRVAHQAHQLGKQQSAPTVDEQAEIEAQEYASSIEWNHEGEQHRGQIRMAYRVAELYRGELKFVLGLGWLVWDGQRWALDEKDAAINAVIATLRLSLAESFGDDKLRRDVAKCESAHGIEGVLKIASALPALRAGVHELDADPYLLNCANGTLDLRTRQLRAHDPADNITRVCRGAYDPEADQTAWATFLGTSLPDDDERDYLQRVIGQGVFGGVREHLFPVLTGDGANGKGTAYGAIKFALGDYATVIDPELLMVKQRGAGGPEMMQLLGARLVIGSETEEGKWLDSSLMKRLTGGDELTARHLYQAPVTWRPSHQIIYVTNHLPKVKGNDPAVWRRIRVVPFDVVIPEGQRDPKLPERLELAADAILTWSVQGWFDYEDRGGMFEPETVRNATDSYQTDSDAVKRFLSTHCHIGPSFKCRSAELFEAWEKWARDDGADPLNKNSFAKELERLGYVSKRSSAGMVWQQIGLPASEF